MKRKHLSKKDKQVLIQMYGNRCLNCGDTENIEWHHVVPLELGGNDIYSNMVPLCYACHKAVTHHALVLATKGRQHNAGGRKRTIPDNYKEILWRYIQCDIGKSECKRLLGLSKSNSLTDNPWYQEFLKEHNISWHRNNIDIRTANGKLHKGCVIGRIYYIGGNTVNCFWQDGEDTVDS